MDTHCRESATVMYPVIISIKIQHLNASDILRGRLDKIYDGNSATDIQ